MTTVALLGAGGKMGGRLTDNLKNHPEYEMLYVEVSPAGVERMASRGVTPTPRDEALARCDALILAVPDAKIKTIAPEAVPHLKPGAMVMSLDPAAGYAGVLPPRPDITYFAAHPCHPPLFETELTPEAQTDWFGGSHARQSVVCALLQGPEAHYALGEKLAADMYAPILRMHRITVEQMAFLEPGLVETTTLTLIAAMKEAFERAVSLGIPREAAWDFLMGHLRIELSIVFGFAGFPFSDGAKLATEKAKERIFLPNWLDNVLTPEAVRRQVAEITGAGE